MTSLPARLSAFVMVFFRDSLHVRHELFQKIRATCFLKLSYPAFPSETKQANRSEGAIKRPSTQSLEIGLCRLAVGRRMLFRSAKASSTVRLAWIPVD